MRSKTQKLKLVLATVALLGAIGAVAIVRSLPLGAGTGTARAAGPSLNQLNSELGQQQTRQHSLSASIAGLDSTISTLDTQIALVQNREANVRATLQRDQAHLAGAQAALTHERALVVLLRRRLSRAQMILARQVVSNYESSRPNLVSVVLNAHGFTQLLEQIDFLARAEDQQQALIAVTRTAKAQADGATVRLGRLEAGDRTITDDAALQARALVGMNTLLQSRQGTLAEARAAQQSALAASRDRGAQLQHTISHVEAEQAAAATNSSELVSGAGSSPALGPSGGWVIPYAIVLCESGGQNLPPNSAGASGYYQIIPSTWRLFDGTGPAAYLASKAEQDAVAARIWNGGAGASNWVCAGIVGIH